MGRRRTSLYQMTYNAIPLAIPFVSQFVRSLGSAHREGSLHVNYCGERDDCGKFCIEWGIQGTERVYKQYQHRLVLQYITF